MSDEATVSRKGFFKKVFGRFGKSVATHVEHKIAKRLNAPIRPPGALDEVEFLAACTRCGECVKACPYGAILNMPVQSGVSANTPYIEPQTQPCMLCDGFPCIQACGDQALLPVPPTETVNIGHAAINPESCLTYDDKVCTLCYDACPYPERAITIGADFHPRILDACVGCGQCEKRCPTTPIGVKVLSPFRHRIAQSEDELYFGLLQEDGETLEETR